MQKVQQSNEPFSIDNNENRVPKQKYSSPQLIEYGSIAKLTKGQNGSGPDGSSGMAMV